MTHMAMARSQTRALMCSKRRHHTLMCLTVMRQGAGFETQSLQATDRQAEHGKSPLCGTKSLCHHSLIWQPQTAIGLLAKRGSVADGYRGWKCGTRCWPHKRSDSETLTSFTPVCLPRAQTKF